MVLLENNFVLMPSHGEENGGGIVKFVEQCNGSGWMELLTPKTSASAAE